MKYGGLFHKISEISSIELPDPIIKLIIPTKLVVILCDSSYILIPLVPWEISISIYKSWLATGVPLLSLSILW